MDEYIGIIMNRKCIDYGTYAFKVEHLVEGTLMSDDAEEESEKVYYFLDQNHCEYLMATDASTTNLDIETVVGYTISKENLMKTYPNLTYQEAKEQYFDELSKYVHIGFFIDSIGKIAIAPMDFITIKAKINDMELNSNAGLIQLNLSDLSDQLNVFENDSELDLTEDYIAIGLEEFDNLLKLEPTDLKKKMQEIQEQYAKSIDELNKEQQKLVKKQINGDYIRDLFCATYERILDVKDLDEMKKIIFSIENLYTELLLEIDNKIEEGYDVKAASEFLYEMIDSYHALLELNDLKEIKEGIRKIQVKESMSIEKLAQKYDNDMLEESFEAKNESNDSIDDLIAELNSLVGLKNIKEEVKKLTAYLNYLSKVKEDTRLDNPNLNMIFTGNPGSGKTTVAKIMAKILYKLGYTRNDKFAETTVKDYIAGYVGQTAIKTNEIISKNKGGVILIDEAYAFSNNSGDFSKDAIAEILKHMEQKDTVFIFAGYDKEMKSFISMNSGLQSRIGFYMNFKDYNIDELYEIFEGKLSKTKIKMNDEAIFKVKEILSNYKGKENFGNGRFIDKLFDKIMMNHALNVIDSNSKEELITITVNDIDESILQEVDAKKKEKIGFL